MMDSAPRRANKDQGHQMKVRTMVVVFLVGIATRSIGQAGEAVSDYASHTINANKVLITCQGAHKVRLTMCRSDVVRVEFDPRGEFYLNPYTRLDSKWDPTKVDLAPSMLKKDWPQVSYTVSDQGSYLKIATQKLTVRVMKSPLRIHFYDVTNTVAINQDDDAIGMKCNTGGGTAPCDLYIQKKKNPAEHFFGFGNGNRGYNADYKCDYTGFYEGPNPSGWYYSGQETYGTPFFCSTLGYAIFPVFDAGVYAEVGNWEGVPSESRFDLGMSAANRYSILYKRKADFTQYTQYLLYYFIYGPEWTTLYDRYTEISGRPLLIQKKFYGIHACLRCDKATGQNCITNDITQYRNGKFPLDGYTSELLPGWSGADEYPASFIATVHDAGLLYGANCNQKYDKAADAAKFQTIVDHGFDILWNDKMGKNMWHHGPRNTFENVKQAFGNDSSRMFMRQGWTAWVGQSLGAPHAGDRNPSKTAFKAYLAYSLGAMPFNMTDLAVGDWESAMYSLFPMIFYHASGTKNIAGVEDVSPRPWEHSASVQEQYRRWMRFHLRMVPYLFTYGCRAHHDGMPILRHMVMADPSNAATYAKDDQAYIGEWLMVAPSMSGTARSVWIPKGTWYDFFDGTIHEGEKTITYDVAGFKLPLFAKAGAIIPLAPEMNYIGEKAEDPLTVRVYPGGHSSFELWEDHTGVTSRFAAHQTATQVSLRVSAFGGSIHSPKNRRYIFEVYTSGKTPLRVALTTGDLAKLSTRADFDAAQSGWFYDGAQGGLCFIKPGVSAEQGLAAYVSYTGTVATSDKAQVQQRSATPPQIRAVDNGVQVALFSEGAHTVSIFSANGRRLAVRSGHGAARYTLATIQGNALLFCTIKTSEGLITRVVAPR